VQVLVDPKYIHLFELQLNPGEDILVHTLQNCESIPHRIWAMKELFAIGTLATIRRVKQFLQEDDGIFYGLHAEAAKLVVKIKSFHKIDSMF